MLISSEGHFLGHKQREVIYPKDAILLRSATWSKKESFGMDAQKVLKPAHVVGPFVDICSI